MSTTDNRGVTHDEVHTVVLAALASRTLGALRGAIDLLPGIEPATGTARMERQLREWLKADDKRQQDAELSAYCTAQQQVNKRRTAINTTVPTVNTVPLFPFREHSLTARKDVALPSMEHLSQEQLDALPSGVTQLEWDYVTCFGEEHPRLRCYRLGCRTPLTWRKGDGVWS